MVGALCRRERIDNREREREREREMGEDREECVVDELDSEQEVSIKSEAFNFCWLVVWSAKPQMIDKEVIQ